MPSSLPRRRSRVTRRGTPRGGFTLLEVLLAAALCTVLVTVCFQAAHLNWKYRLASETTTTESRLRLGLLEDFSMDLRAALAPVEQGTSPVVPTAFDALPRADFTEQFLSIERDVPVRPLYFIGTPTALLLLRETGSPRFPSSTGSSGGIHHVLWWSQSTGAPRLPYALNGHQRLQRAPEAPLGAAGLMRTMWLVHEGFPSPSSAAKPSRSAAVESTVQRVTFRYFDGTSWRSDWDSSEARLLPVAVEVSLTWQDAAEPPLRSVLHLPQAGRRTVPTSTDRDLATATERRPGSPAHQNPRQK